MEGGILTNDYNTIDTYANIFSDVPYAGRNIFPAKVMDHLDLLDESGIASLVPTADDASNSEEIQLQYTVDVRPKKSKEKGSKFNSEAVSFREGDPEEELSRQTPRWPEQQPVSWISLAAYLPVGACPNH
ncbi:hypothetical protein E4U57_003568 [Claviceps arundinis]|uniref:Uncharacterized protein n=1 Tax=Claviceps arundinis TaxID=1623583 RepID=A0A9P7MXH5_9HYPO|nr:hypothetical protein E4U57_003568 [Claviceps arundinis]KAG5975594.1 hypothetical protein E4U56_003537 [Claviceps arundinis]